jgi:hypothetical protein
MRTCFGALALLAWAGVAPAAEPPHAKASPAPKSSCIECHSQLDGEAAEPVKHAADDVHFQQGLSCHDCHGGNPDSEPDDVVAAHDEKKGWNRPTRLTIPLFCAKCHADAAFMKRFDPMARVDQLAEYRTSMHGRRNATGDAKVAVCIDCHGVHGIKAVKDPSAPVHHTHVAETCGRCHANAELMRPYGLPATEPAAYKSSVHARALYEKGDLAAPTCNNCHGSHGAAPPGLQSVVQVCGSCHGREATLFREVEKKKGLNLAPCIQCMVCHDNHAVQAPTDEMIGVGPKSTCTTCHGPSDPPYRSAELMAASLERLKVRHAEASDLLARAGRAGIEVGADQVALQKASDQIVELRVLAHSFDRERYLAAAGAGLATVEVGVAAGERAFRELRQRRLGLAVSLVVIAAVIAGLLFKIRDMEGPRPEP